MIKKLLGVLPLLCITTAAQAALFVTDGNNGSCNITSSATFQTGTVVDSTDGLTGTKDYLVLFRTGVYVETGTSRAADIAFRHNTTQLAFGRRDPSSNNTTKREPMDFAYLCNDCPSTDSFDIQYRVNIAGGNMGSCNEQILAIDLSHMTEDTSFWISDTEPGVDVTTPTTTSWTDATTAITIPAGYSGRDILLIGRGVYDADTTTGFGRIAFEIDNTTQIYTESKFDVPATGSDRPFVVYYVYTVPDSSSHTVQLQYYSEVGNNKWADLMVYAIDLDHLSSFVAFEQSQSLETNATDAYVDYAGAADTIAVGTTGDYVILGSGIGYNSTTNGIKTRLYYNNTTSYGESIWDQSGDEIVMTSAFGVVAIGTTGNYDVDWQYDNEDGDSSTVNMETGIILMLLETDGSEVSMGGDRRIWTAQ